MKALRIAAGLSVLACMAAAPAQAPQPARLVESLAPAGTQTASIDLAAEFPNIPQLKGFSLSQILIVVPPGTGRPWHSHAGMPEIVRVLSGNLTDARNGEAPKTYGPGATLINASGTQHMWANLGTDPVVFIATVMRPAP